MNPTTAEWQESRAKLLKSVDEAAKVLEFDAPQGDGRYAVSPLRRGQRRRLNDPCGMLTLIRTEAGVLTWQEGSAAAPLSGRRGFRRGPLPEVSGEVIARKPYTKVLGLNEVSKYLVSLDTYLNAAAFVDDKAGNLRRWTENNGLQTDGAPPANERSLVFVHGTFSSSDYLVAQLTNIEKVTGFLKEARAVYKNNIFAFDHPTLSISPVLNALDLARRFAHVKAPVDVICHSRGGLVVRWWLEVIAPQLARQGGRVVMVGSPSAGTSLASPANLRTALDFFTSVGHALQSTGTAVSFVAPFMVMPLGLLKILNSVVSAGAKTPLIDAVVAMIPGLAGQSRVKNNFELNRLRDKSLPLPEYHVIQTRFKPPPVTWWKFLDYFKNNWLAHWGADFLFKDANDLVVDTDSMADFIEGMPLNPQQIKNFVYDFGQSATVHHTNYFQQKATAEFIIEKMMKAAVRH